MKKRLVKLALLAAAALFTAAPASAQSVDDKIKSLEQELTQLKEQQIEMKKEATAAAAAMPTFSYRPGNGVMIQKVGFRNLRPLGIRAPIEPR
jgi:Flp pilus assembly protein TadD